MYRKWCETPPIAPTSSPTETPPCYQSTITPADPTKFNIQLVRFGPPSDYDQLFQEAADRWASFISRDLGVYGPLNYAAADPYPATRRKLEEGPGFEVLTPTESFTLDGDDEYVVEVEPVPLDA